MQTKSWSTAAVNALMLSIVTIVVNLIQAVFEPGTLLSILIWIVKFAGCLALLYYFIKEFSKGFESFSYKDGFNFGFKLCLLSSIICAGFIFLQYAVLFPDALQNSIEQVSSAMESSNPSAVEMIEKFMNPQFMFVYTFIYYTVFGMIASAIIANYTKKGDIFKDNQIN
jgi:hypothetical protein